MTITGSNQALAESLDAAHQAHQARQGQTLAERQFDLDGRDRYESAAAQNGMTAEAMAAASYVQSIASHLSVDAKAVLANPSSAIPALEQVAAIQMPEESLDLREMVDSAIRKSAMVGVEGV